MHTLTLILLVIAAISFGLAAAGVPSRVNLVALGLLAWVAVPLITALQLGGQAIDGRTSVSCAVDRPCVVRVAGADLHADGHRMADAHRWVTCPRLARG